jgi:50S ribosomal protein L16 3-hydroxylase
VEQYELDRIRQMMIDMISKPEDFTKWFGSFVSTPRHELDIAAAEPPYAPEEVLDALQGGETLSRLSGLRAEHQRQLLYQQRTAGDGRREGGGCAVPLHRTRPGRAGRCAENPAFVEELTGLINQGYWYFDE